MAKGLILIVEDDQVTADLIKTVLESDHYTVHHARTALQGRSLVEKLRPDLVVLDRNLPDKDGLDFCKELRAMPQTKSLPVLFLTGRKSVAEKVMGLSMGGDDYLTKPFSNEELLARVEALLRRSQRTAEVSGVLTHGGIEINVDNRTAKIDGEPVELTNKEFDLMRAFLERPDRVLTRRFLLSHVWGYDMELEMNTKAVDMVILGLRKKLGAWSEVIEAVKGYGYRLGPVPGKGKPK